MTKWVEAEAVSLESTKESARNHADQIVCRFGAPQFIRSDRG